MTCPQCGQENQEHTKFCRKCGANLQQALAERARGTAPNPLLEGGQTSREMLARALIERVQQEVRQPGNSGLWGMIFGEDRSDEIDQIVSALNRFLESPAEKRLRRIRVGVVTAAVGLGVSFFLFILFAALGNFIGGELGRFIRSLWAVGLIPLFIGLGLIISGFLFAKARNLAAEFEVPLSGAKDDPRLRDQTVASSAGGAGPVSVTEHTTTRLDLPETSRRT